MKPNRIIIYPKDGQLITGKSDQYARDLLKKIRLKLNKEEHQLVTIEEFCQFTGIDPENVHQFLVS